MADGTVNLVEACRAARKAPDLAVLEGFHPLKHALRFGATPQLVATSDPERIRALAAALAPDVAARIEHALAVVPAELLAAATPAPLPEPLVAIAARVPADPTAILGNVAPAPVVLLDEPSNLSNVGAVIRVAAAAGAAGVLVAGSHDPWHPQAIRGAAGLQYAVPCARVDALPQTDRPIVCVSGEGAPLQATHIPARALLVFGSERRGIGPALRARCAATVAIPMQPGVSSLNLATAVAVVLYACRRLGEVSDWRGGE